MTFLNRLILGIARVRQAWRLGFHFTGTSHPKPLDQLNIARGIRKIAGPENEGHWHDFINVILDDEYGLRSIEKSPDIIVDLGANIGVFSIWARHCFPTALVHCYEPNPKLWQFLETNLKDCRVSIFRTGVAGKAGRGQLVSETDSRCSRAILNDEDGELIFDSIGDVFDRVGGIVDLLKLDIEGGEWEFLSPEMLNKFSKVSRIVMEYHEINGKRVEDLISAFESVGFVLEKISRNRGFGIIWLSRGP